MSRGSKSSFSRDSSLSDEIIKSLTKTSVNSVKDDGELFGQINSILGTKSKYSTVQEAVEDMQKRSGLSHYLSLNASSSEVKKEASDDLEVTLDPVFDKNQMPKLLQEKPQVKGLIDNFITSRMGHVHVQAVVDKVSTLFKSDGISSDEFEDKHLRKYINDMIIEEKKKHSSDSANSSYSEMGKADFSTSDNDNHDAFKLLEPAKF